MFFHGIKYDSISCLALGKFLNPVKVDPTTKPISLSLAFCNEMLNPSENIIPKKNSHKSFQVFHNAPLNPSVKSPWSKFSHCLRREPSRSNVRPSTQRGALQKSYFLKLFDWWPPFPKKIPVLALGCQWTPLHRRSPNISLTVYQAKIKGYSKKLRSLDLAAYDAIGRDRVREAKLHK